jgi:hypothetical protein
MEDMGNDSPPESNRSKRVKKFSSQSTRTESEPRHRGTETSTLEPCGDRLNVGDDNACSAFYIRLLTDAQQGLCKRLGKWWIKAINPNKQTKNPYAGGSGTKPNWWPMTPPNNALGEPNPGTLENGFVRHKEPDHLTRSGKDTSHC